MEAGTEGTRRSQRRELQRGTAVKSTTKLAPSHTVIPSFKAIIQKTRFWPTKPDCGPPLPLGVLLPRGGRTGKGGGGGLLPGPLSARGGKKNKNEEARLLLAYFSLLDDTRSTRSLALSLFSPSATLASPHVSMHEHPPPASPLVHVLSGVSDSV